MFRSWGMEVLVTQLYDQSRAVAMAALNVVDEACEVQVSLNVFVLFYFLWNRYVGKNTFFVLSNDIKLHPMVRRLFLSTGVEGVTIHYHYFQISL